MFREIGLDAEKDGIDYEAFKMLVIPPTPQ
jgi:hypothetical protein